MKNMKYTCVMNTIDCTDYILYYNKKTNDFEAYKSNARKVQNNPNQFIECPYKGAYKSDVWKRFYEMLNEEETVIANSYSYRKGYFEYLRETGLIGYYEEAERFVHQEVFKKWCQHNDIVFEQDMLEFI